MARDRDHQGDHRGPASAGPPPLDPSLILRARTALHAAGLPGDAASDEDVAGLVAAMGLVWDDMTLIDQEELYEWLATVRRSRPV